MIKWGEFRQADAIFEAFLPEHEAEPQEWLLRTSRLGHVVEERRVRLTWPPRFGPDAGDVAALEAELDAAIERVAIRTAPAKTGSYVVAPGEMPAPDPLVHAGLHGLLEEYLAAEHSLRLSSEQSQVYLNLPVVSGARGLYPAAITQCRETRMRRLIALSTLVARYPAVADRTAELVAALSTDDLPLVSQVLSAAGVDVGSESGS